MEVEKNEGGNYRGMHIVIINPTNGGVEWAVVFDTYKSSKELDFFIKNAYIPEGFIIAVACMDECTLNLSEESKKWFGE